MEKSKGYDGLGILLVLLGGLFLLQNFGFLGGLGDFIWAMLFGFGGLAFLIVFLANRENWWALIPGFTLLGLAGTMVLGELDTGGGATGGFFLASIGSAFLVIYLIRREHWWAIIPAGVLLTLALIATLSSVLPGETGASLLFFGLAATFGALYLIPTPLDHPTWALIPAGIMGVIGLLLFIAGGSMSGLIMPFVLIALGGIIVLRALRRN